MRFDQDEMLTEARQRAGLSDFGSDVFLDPMRRLLDSLEHESGMNALGRVRMFERILGWLVGMSFAVSVSSLRLANKGPQTPGCSRGD